LRSGVLAFGALIWAAPAFAQASPDPLAPLPSTPPVTQQPASTASDRLAPEPVKPQQPIAISPSTAASKSVAVPRDWRGVFDAIDAGQWASAQAGIAALPPDVLSPVAKAEQIGRASCRERV